MKRIMIIGAPGSGKSTLAQGLGAHFDLPVYHIDREVHWLPDWQERPRDEKIRIAQDIEARERWVFEGGLSSTYTNRAARADMLVWLDLPIALRLFRVIRRSVRDRGKTRPDMAEHCPERLSLLPEFIGFILRTRKTSRRRQRAVFEAATCSKYHLQSPRAVARFERAL